MDARTETLWRGVLSGDSLYVRARWVPGAVGASCAAYRDIFESDSVTSWPTFLEYWIENSRGRILHRATVSGFTTPHSPEPDFYWCCEGMGANATPWRN